MVFLGISPNFISSCTTGLFGQHAYWSCFLWFLCRESIFYVELRHGLPRIFGHVYDVYRLAAVSKFISIYREQRQDNTPNMICRSSTFSDHISTKNGSIFSVQFWPCSYHLWCQNWAWLHQLDAPFISDFILNFYFCCIYYACNLSFIDWIDFITCQVQ